MKTVGVLLVLALASAPVQAFDVGEFRTVALALGYLMMVLMGIKWIIADSPNDRADAKKGMMYVVIGLLLVASACSLLHLYESTAGASVSGFSYSSWGSVGC